MRLVVIADLHANLPALDAVLGQVGDDYDQFVHLGDAIACGPFPRECLERLAALPRALHLRGNHDELYLRPASEPPPAHLPAEVWRHHRWTHGQLGPGWRETLAQWPRQVEAHVAGLRVLFAHFASAGPTANLVPVPNELDGEALDGLFAHTQADLVFFGHDHRPTNAKGERRYVNPGSLGCCKEGPFARYVTAELGPTLTVTHELIPYDERPLFHALRDRGVPALRELDEPSYGGRLGRFLEDRG